MVNKHLERIEAAKCSMDLANYLLKAVIGGILNYHAPFTKLTQEDLRKIDAKIRKILRHKGGLPKGVRLGALYDKTHGGIGI